MVENVKYTLRLYIAGITTENQETIIGFKQLLKQVLGGDYRLEVIDIFENPELAEGERIVATPTLVKAIPGPIQKVILDFSSKEKLLLGISVHDNFSYHRSM